MHDYIHPQREVEFLLQQVLGLSQLCQREGGEAFDADLLPVILAEAARLASEVLVPLNRSGDRDGCRLGAEGVEQAPGFREAYRQFIDGGWNGLTASSAFGGQGLPNLVGFAVDEIWQSANMAFSLCPLLTQGAAELIATHGSDALQREYLHHMVSGQWSGTMNLTEPDAGTDLAALKTRAWPEGDHYRLSGQKIFITWGDHRMTDNIVHLVLARLPDAPAGVKGISLFLVPKYLPGKDGEPGEANDLSCIAIEHKLGIHASPTCVMSYGDREGAIGYLIGEPHQGLAQMFTMMNSARQAVGLQGVAIAERAYQQARDYARQRLQGTRPDGSRFTIIHFPDVRRMLMLMKAATEAMRALAYAAAAEADHARLVPDAEQRGRHQARLELLTPIVKGWCTELAQEVTYLAGQVHGGMGYIEETGVAQHYRDARILTIYEGTTGIQALDLVGRKTLLDGGQALSDWFAEIETTLEVLEASNALGCRGVGLRKALDAARVARAWLLENATRDPAAAGCVSVPFMMLLGYLGGGWMLARAALKAQEQLDTGEGDAAFLQAKKATCLFYHEHLLPRTQGYLDSLLAGSGSVMAVPEDQF